MVKVQPQDWAGSNLVEDSGLMDLVVFIILVGLACQCGGHHFAIGVPDAEELTWSLRQND
jgi:hypothetical protein